MELLEARCSLSGGGGRQFSVGRVVGDPRGDSETLLQDFLVSVLVPAVVGDLTSKLIPEVFIFVR